MLLAGSPTAFGLLLFTVWGGSASAQVVDPCAPVQNPIVCENSKPGTPQSEWDVNGGGDPSIEGFATDISVDHGETVHFKIDTPSTAYHLDIYRMGYYGGDGARKVATVTPSASLPQAQPTCDTDVPVGLVDCGNWSESAHWDVPADAVSGIYFAKLVRDDDPSSEGSHILFIVRDDEGQSDLLFQTSDTTWQAYNRYGGNSLYSAEGEDGSPAGRAYKVSYNRPFETRGPTPEDSPFNAEYPMVRFLERNGYDVSYFTGVDADRRGSEMLEHKTYLSVGHDEYWSGTQRANVEAARAAGVNLAFFSGNEVFWKTRWENSIDGSGTDHRTLVCYKETHDGAKIDPGPPGNPNVWTGTWRDPRFSPPADGGRPENGLTGTIFTVNDGTSAIEVPAADGKLRFWRNTSIAGLAPGQTATLSDSTLGYEWDEDLDNGARPAGLIDMSSTPVDVPQRITDYGSNYGPGHATHSLTLYKAPSGALVFGAGTIQWSWGLDGDHDRGGSTPDSRMQQATVNLLADMGTQPDRLQAGLVTGTASTDTDPPTATISSPLADSNVESGVQTTISGTASDVGGGQVGSVEVSTDGGSTWHPAQGHEQWTYSWTPGTTGSATIKARAVDDS
ncbi:MAG TPA: N,N-dimethylformamidase beta subunit family domain-containing protein, partial [Nocardioidaceae bacterium]